MPLKYQDPLTQQHRITSQKTRYVTAATSTELQQDTSKDLQTLNRM